jgi:hypothetical protein
MTDVTAQDLGRIANLLTQVQMTETNMGVYLEGNVGVLAEDGTRLATATLNGNSEHTVHVTTW